MEGKVVHIAVIESLLNERETGTELYNDVISRGCERDNCSITHELVKVHTKTELLAILSEYQKKGANFQDGLLIHIEMHGTADLTGLVLSDNSVITWEELIKALRPINIQTNNHLYLSIATCNGRFLYKGVRPDEKSPYRAFISANKAVFPSEIVEQYSILFEKLIELGNLIPAYLHSETTKSQFYYKDSKVTFEEAFQSTADKMMNDPKIRKAMLKETEKQVKAQGLQMPPAFSFDYIVRLAIRASYEKFKKAFDF